MRLWVTFLALSVTAQQPPAKPADAAKPLASVEGRLTDSLTGEPVRKALITLNTPNSSSASAESGADGIFAVKDVEAGTYLIYVERAGYIRQSYGQSAGQLSSGTSITVQAGQKLTGIDFKLTRQGVVSGRVLDEDGEPVQHASVMVLQQQPFSSQPTPLLGDATNDEGGFRIAGLVPGKYFLRADYRQRVARPLPNPEGVLAYVSTFYPGATEMGGALPMQILPGQHVSGLDIRLRKTRTLQVSGTVTGLSPDTRATISLHPTVRGGASSPSAGGGTVKPDGSFVASMVLPGTYDVSAVTYESRMMQVLGRTPVTVAGRNVENVLIHVTKPIEVKGRVLFDGESTEKVSGQVSLTSLQRRPLMIEPSRIQSDGTFKFGSVPRESVVLHFFGLPDSYFVSAISYSGVDVIENGLDLSSAGSSVDVEVRLRPKAATVEGVVRDGEGNPVPGSLVTIFPEPFRPDRPSAALYRRQVNTDQNGRFIGKGLAPGEYRIYAWNIGFFNWYDLDPEKLKPYEKNAVLVKLKEASKEQADVKLNLLTTE